MYYCFFNFLLSFLLFSPLRFGKHLTKKGLKPANTHLVGHSLGAHIMSYMAKGLKTPRQLGRLTGKVLFIN